PSSFKEKVSELQRAKRCLRRGLEQDRRSQSERWRQLVRHQIQRKVKWRDGEDWACGKAPHHAPSAFIAFEQIERQHFTAFTHCFFCRSREGQDGTLDFHPRSLERLPCFGNNQLRQIVFLCGDFFRDTLQNLLALITGQLAGFGK